MVSVSVELLFAPTGSVAPPVTEIVAVLTRVPEAPGETCAATQSNLRRSADCDRRPGAANLPPAARFACGCADGLWRQPDPAQRHRLQDAANHLDQC